MNAPDPREELARLARGLAAHLRRQTRLGRARADRPPTPVQEVAAVPDAPARQGPEGEAVLVPRARPRQPGAATPEARPGPGGGRPGAGKTAASAAPARAEAPESETAPAALPPAEVEARAAGNRAAAAACGDLESLRARVAGCTACPLAATRTQTVFSDGTGRAGVMFVGEGPGFHEDQAGVPFVGRAGALLSDIVTKGMGLAREDVYIANVVKCRPPENRDPTPAEKAVCTPFLDRQVELVDPRVLIPLGRHAAGHVLGSQASMSSMRARVHEVGGRKVVPTYHPAYLLRSPGQKKACWEDIQRAMQVLGLERPRRDEAGSGPPSGS